VSIVDQEQLRVITSHGVDILVDVTTEAAQRSEEKVLYRTPPMSLISIRVYIIFATRVIDIHTVELKKTSSN